MSSVEPFSRSEEDTLFVFLAAFYRVPPHTDQWNLLFSETFTKTLLESEKQKNGLMKALSLRMSYSIFVSELVRVLSAVRSENQVIFSLRNLSEAEVQDAPPERLPALLERASSESIDAYYSNYLVVSGEGFLRRRFRTHRMQWLREVFVKSLPFLALAITLAISVLALHAMRKPVDGEGLGAGAFTDVLWGVDVATLSTEPRASFTA